VAVGGGTVDGAVVTTTSTSITTIISSEVITATTSLTTIARMSRIEPATLGSIIPSTVVAPPTPIKPLHGNMAGLLAANH